MQGLYRSVCRLYAGQDDISGVEMPSQTSRTRHLSTALVRIPSHDTKRSVLLHSNNESMFEELKRRWIRSGQSRTPNWEELFANLET